MASGKAHSCVEALIVGRAEDRKEEEKDEHVEPDHQTCYLTRSARKRDENVLSDRL